MPRFQPTPGAPCFLVGSHWLYERRGPGDALSEPRARDGRLPVLVERVDGNRSLVSVDYYRRTLYAWVDSSWLRWPRREPAPAPPSPTTLFGD